jgi:hypothetical protein
VEVGSGRDEIGGAAPDQLVFREAEQRTGRRVGIGAAPLAIGDQHGLERVFEDGPKCVAAGGTGLALASVVHVSSG